MGGRPGTEGAGDAGRAGARRWLHRPFGKPGAVPVSVASLAGAAARRRPRGAPSLPWSVRRIEAGVSVETGATRHLARRCRSPPAGCAGVGARRLAGPRSDWRECARHSRCSAGGAHAAASPDGRLPRHRHGGRDPGGRVRTHPGWQPNARVAPGDCAAGLCRLPARGWARVRLRADPLGTDGARRCSGAARGVREGRAV